MKSLETCNVAMKYSDGNGTWRYNKAFLFLFFGKYSEALKVYSEIENFKYEGEEITISQVIYFNETRLVNDHNDLISNFILGFVYLKKRYNPPQALEYFEKIIEYHSGQDKLKEINQKVKNYIVEIRRNIGIK